MGAFEAAIPREELSVLDYRPSADPFDEEESSFT